MKSKSKIKEVLLPETLHKIAKRLQDYGNPLQKTDQLIVTEHVINIPVKCKIVTHESKDGPDSIIITSMPVNFTVLLTPKYDSTEVVIISNDESIFDNVLSSL